MTILREEAIYKLANHSSYRHNDTEILDWSNGDPPTEEEIETTRLEMQAEYDAQEYARDRATSYPTWQEQMDMQYHDQLDGTTTWKDAIAKVKSDNPKE